MLASPITLFCHITELCPLLDLEISHLSFACKLIYPHLRQILLQNFTQIYGMTMEAHEIKFYNFVWLFSKLCPLLDLENLRLKFCMKTQIKVLHASSFFLS